MLHQNELVRQVLLQIYPDKAACDRAIWRRQLHCDSDSAHGLRARRRASRGTLQRAVDAVRRMQEDGTLDTADAAYAARTGPAAIDLIVLAADTARMEESATPVAPPVRRTRSPMFPRPDDTASLVVQPGER